MRPSRCLPPLLYWPGTRPIHAATWRPLSNSWPPPRLASSALAVVGGTDAGQLHETSAPRVLARCLGNGAVVLVDDGVQPVRVGKQVSHAAIGVARQVLEMSGYRAPQADHLLRQHDAELADQAAQAVVERGALFDESLPRAVKGEDQLLVFLLHRDEAHGGTSDGFANGGGVRGVVLAALAAHAVRRDELGGDQLDGVAVLTELPGPVMRAGAGFHADQAGGQLRNERQQFRTRKLRPDECGLAVIIHPVHGKHVLCEIDSNRDNAHGLPLPWS